MGLPKTVPSTSIHALLETPAGAYGGPSWWLFVGPAHPWKRKVAARIRIRIRPWIVSNWIDFCRINLLFGPEVYKIFGFIRERRGINFAPNRKTFKPEPERKDI